MANDLTKRNEKGQWLPGVPTNPSGRPKAPAEIRAGRKMLSNLFEFYGQKLAQCTVEQIRKIITDKETTAWEGIIAANYAKALEGSSIHAELLFNRLIGKPPERFFISQDDERDSRKEKILNMSEEELLLHMKALSGELRELSGGTVETIKAT